ncbi:MAG: hypothetical protein M1823_001579 [Watsoniomyces obsoletus]|nr:MAG: hypothetical protein M1823_001579 [Watsoniomyces obsoletus]
MIPVSLQPPTIPPPALTGARPALETLDVNAPFTPLPYLCPFPGCGEALPYQSHLTVHGRIHRVPESNPRAIGSGSGRKRKREYRTVFIRTHDELLTILCTYRIQQRTFTRDILSRVGQVDCPIFFLDLEFAFNGRSDWLVCQVALVNIHGTTVFDVVLDPEATFDALKKRFGHHRPCMLVIGKFYGSQQDVLRSIISRKELADRLSSLFRPETLVVEWSSNGFDGKLLRDTLAQVSRSDVMPKEASFRLVQPFRETLPGLPKYSLSTVFSLLFPRNPLCAKKHFAGPDALMLQKIVSFMKQVYDGQF